MPRMNVKIDKLYKRGKRQISESMLVNVKIRHVKKITFIWTSKSEIPQSIPVAFHEILLDFGEK